MLTRSLSDEDVDICILHWLLVIYAMSDDSQLGSAIISTTFTYVTTGKSVINLLSYSYENLGHNICLNEHI